MSASGPSEMEALLALQRQREALARGREKVNAQRQRAARHLRVLIFDLAAADAAADAQAGKPAWGRAGRIARKLQGRVGERHIRKILSALRAQ